MMDEMRNSEWLGAIEQTAAMVGHDIRNPLQAIEGALFLMKKEVGLLPSQLDETQNIIDLVATIEEQAQYINKIVSDLQDFARPLIPELEKTDLRALMDGVLSLVDFPQTVEVKVSVEDGFPEILTDPAYLRRVLTNLVSNALAAMPYGGDLNIRAFREEGATLITVEDTGTGIPEEFRSRVFQPLFTSKSKGQGLGLPVCKRMVEALGGTITFVSQVGKGTTFTVTMP